MKSILISCILCLLTISCKKDMDLVEKTYSKTSNTNCVGEYNCAKINLKIIEASNNSFVSDSINKKIFDVVKNTVYAGENPDEIKNYSELNTFFISEFNAMKDDLKQEKLPSWEAVLNTKIAYHSKEILNITIDSYTYTGGAHGYNAIQSLIFNTKTGKIISSKKLFKNTSAIEKIAENEFRKQQKITATLSLTDAGYFFENDKFVLPQNIIITKKGLLLHYNPYEAASYGQGPIEVELPFSTIKPYMYNNLD